MYYRIYQDKNIGSIKLFVKIDILRKGNNVNLSVFVCNSYIWLSLIVTHNLWEVLQVSNISTFNGELKKYLVCLKIRILPKKMNLITNICKFRSHDQNKLINKF